MKSAPIAMVASLGISAQPVCTLSVQWSDSAQRSFGPPKVGDHFTCQALARGMLLLCQGEIHETATGTLPRVRLVMQEHCVALRLRQQMRYKVQGCGTVSDLSNATTFSSKMPHAMDISTGGFGLDTGEMAWEAGQQLSFELELFVERGGQPRRDLPSLELSGLARVRSVYPATTGVHLGCEFAELTGEQREQLEFWLTVHECYLRQE